MYSARRAESAVVEATPTTGAGAGPLHWLQSKLRRFFALLCGVAADGEGAVSGSAGLLRDEEVSVAFILFFPADKGGYFDFSRNAKLHRNFFQHLNTDFAGSDFAQGNNGWFVFCFNLWCVTLQ
jgi:hypothetical protein